MPQVIGQVIAAGLTVVGVPLLLAELIGNALGNVAFAVGVSLGLGALAKLGAQPTQQASVKPSDGQQQIKQAIPPRWRSYGTVRLTGPVFWLDAEVATKKLYLGVVLNHGLIDGFVSYHLDDAEVQIDGSGAVTTAPYAVATTKILTRLGLPTETAYAEINSAFSVADVRGDGVATMLGIFPTAADAPTQLTTYPNGVPRFRATIHASVVWDPRDPDQDRADATTWQWSENPVVCLLDYLLDPNGFALPFDRFSGNLAEWKAAMDDCDTLVASINAGGYEKRYRVAGTFLFTDKPATVVSRFLSTCDGRCWQKRDGSVGITVGVFRRSNAVFRDADILDYDLTPGQDRLTAVAGVRAQYMSPDHDYREQDAEPWPDGETVMALGEDRVATLDLLWVPSFSQARRLMKRAALREAADWRGTIRTTLAGLRSIDARYIEVEITELGISRTFEVSRFQIDPATLQCSLEVLSVGSEIDAWDPTTEEGTPASQTILTAWAATFDNQSVFGGLTLRQQILGTSLVASGNQVRLTLQASAATAGLTTTHVAIVPRSGATSDGTTTPTEITFAGASGFAVGIGETITSDWITFPIAVGTSYLVVLDVPNVPAARAAYVHPSADGSDCYFSIGTSYDAVSMPGASALYGGDVAVSKVEVRAGA